MQKDDIATPATIPFIDLKSQFRVLEKEIKARIDTVLEHGKYIMGPEVEELEEKLCDYTGAKYCITVSSGTDALLISLMALGIKHGDEVITTSFSFIATAEVIVMLGATPVFVDVEPDTCNINTNQIENKITKRTRAILPVSLYGQPGNMDEINAIGDKYKLPVIEDAAQSFGATYKGKKSTNLSTIGCTSFFPSKPLGCYGDGGAIFTSDDVLAKACREIRVHGQSQRYVHTRIGIGGRMDTMQCAIILAKLQRFDWEVEKRQELGKQYNNFIDQAGIERIQQRNDRTSIFAQYTILVDKRAEYQRALTDSGIPSAIHYPITLNKQEAYRKYDNEEMKQSATASLRVLSLPMSPYLTTENQEKIIKIIAMLHKRIN